MLQAKRDGMTRNSRQRYLARRLGSAALAAALAALSGAVAFATTSADHLANLANRSLQTAEAQKDQNQALAFYRQAAELAGQAVAANPNSARANFVFFAAKGRLLLAEGATKNLFQLSSLDDYLDRALQLDPNYSNALAAKGGLLLELPFYLGGDAKQAEALLRRAVELNPTGPGTRTTLARALLHNGNVAAAREQVIKACHYACTLRRYRHFVEAQALLEEIDVKLGRAQAQ